MLNVSVRLSKFILLNLKRSDISNGRRVVMVVVEGVIDSMHSSNCVV